MKNTIILLFIFVLCGCSSKIRTITAFEKQNNVLVKRIETEFDKKGNEIKETWFGKTYDRIKLTEYKKERKISVINCEIYKNENDCKLNSFSKIVYNPKDNTETETMYVNDSLIWSITSRRKEKNLIVVKKFSWEHEAAKNPNYDNAFVITDSLFLDNQKRVVKVVSRSRVHKQPFITLYTYTNDGHSYEIKGTRMDTLYHIKYSDEQKKIRKSFPDFEFYPEGTYKIDYY